MRSSADRKKYCTKSGLNKFVRYLISLLWMVGRINIIPPSVIVFSTIHYKTNPIKEVDSTVWTSLVLNERSVEQLLSIAPKNLLLTGAGWRCCCRTQFWTHYIEPKARSSSSCCGGRVCVLHRGRIVSIVVSATKEVLMPNERLLLVKRSQEVFSWASHPRWQHVWRLAWQQFGRRCRWCWVLLTTTSAIGVAWRFMAITTWKIAPVSVYLEQEQKFCHKRTIKLCLEYSPLDSRYITPVRIN